MRHARRLPVCTRCLQSVPELTLPPCRQCGKALPLADESGERICLHCLADPPDYDGAICSAAYSGAGRELIHLLKFGGVRPVAEFWAQRMAALAPRLPEPPDLVVPVPLGRRRQRERGFNQSGEIARRLAVALGCAYGPKALRRRQETTPQSGLPLSERERNLSGAFAADRARLDGRSVLLVDDVLTTGATARAAARVLRRAGARRVMLAVAARTELEFQTQMGAVA
ncbi:MAG: ComF family protein [Terriglobales bacterium]